MIQAAPTPTALGATATTPDSQQAAKQQKLKSAAQAFEAVFLRQMIGSMRDANLGDGMFDNEGTETFQAQADSKTADSMASKNVLGIANMLLKQLGPIASKAGGTAGASADKADVTALAHASVPLAMPKPSIVE